MPEPTFEAREDCRRVALIDLDRQRQAVCNINPARCLAVAEGADGRRKDLRLWVVGDLLGVTYGCIYEVVQSVVPDADSPDQGGLLPAFDLVECPDRDIG